MLAAAAILLASVVVAIAAVVLASSLCVVIDFVLLSVFPDYCLTETFTDATVGCFAVAVAGGNACLFAVDAAVVVTVVRARCCCHCRFHCRCRCR